MSNKKLVAKYILLGLGVVVPFSGSTWWMFEIMNVGLIESGVYPETLVLLGAILFLLHYVVGALGLVLLLIMFWVWILDIPGKSGEKRDD